MAFALVQLDAGSALRDRLQHPCVRITDDPLGLAGQRAEKPALVGGMPTRERFRSPQP
jgi:hypothetical protein